MTLAAGTSLGPYQILGCIGAGGMGEVYRALDPRLGREVAVKVLPLAAAGDAEQMRRLDLEARAAGALNHPGVLAVFDIGREGGTSYVVSELLEGETLRQRLAAGGLPLRKAIELAVAIAHGLAAAHDKGIVHRDLKPENLFITRDGRPKILDFGLARVRPLAGSPQDATGSLVAGTEPGTIMGTVGYMSPEQVRGQEADQRSDIFSLGAVLYEMLAGRRAYHADTAAETMTAILKQDPAELPASVPVALDRVVRRCVEKRAEERFHSARDLAFALEAMSGAGTTTATRVEPTRRRGAGWLVPLLAALVLAASYAGLFVWGRRTATTASPRFRQLTFRRGPIDSARFAPDGQTVVFSANWEGRGFDLMTARIGSPEWRSLGLPAGNVAAISSGGEIALLIGAARRTRLARVPLAGGAPREVAEDVTDADWAPDGEHLAICRAPGTLDILEYPIGHKLLETPGRVGQPRVSPAGDHVAIVASGRTGTQSVQLVDAQGHSLTLSDGWRAVTGLHWSPTGDELWFTALEAGGATSLNAVSLRGRTRELARMAGPFELNDVSRDGRLLATTHVARTEVRGLAPGAPAERDLAWLDSTGPVDLSEDGRLLLITEDGVGGGGGAGTVYLRATDGSPAVRLGEGLSLGLSPDARMVLVQTPDHRLASISVGAGEPRTLDAPGLEDFQGAQWLPGNRVFFSATGEGRNWRGYVQDLAGGAPRPVTPEGTFTQNGTRPVSPDGSVAFAADTSARRVRLFPLDGAAPREIAGLGTADRPLRWSADGKALYVAHSDGADTQVVERLELANGRRAPLLRLQIPDSIGVSNIHALLLSGDGRNYVFAYRRRHSDLYLVEGIR